MSDESLIVIYNTFFFLPLVLCMQMRVSWHRCNAANSSSEWWSLQIICDTLYIGSVS